MASDRTQGQRLLGDRNELVYMGYFLDAGCFQKHHLTSYPSFLLKRHEQLQFSELSQTKATFIGGNQL